MVSASSAGPFLREVAAGATASARSRSKRAPPRGLAKGVFTLLSGSGSETEVNTETGAEADRGSDITAGASSRRPPACSSPARSASLASAASADASALALLMPSARCASLSLTLTGPPRTPAGSCPSSCCLPCAGDDGKPHATSASCFTASAPLMNSAGMSSTGLMTELGVAVGSSASSREQDEPATTLTVRKSCSDGPACPAGFTVLVKKLLVMTSSGIRPESDASSPPRRTTRRRPTFAKPCLLLIVKIDSRSA